MWYDIYVATPTLDLRNNNDSAQQEQEAAPKRPDTPSPEEETDSSTPAPQGDPQPRLARGTVLISWKAPEYVMYKKNTFWYMGFGIAFALLLFIAIFMLQSFLATVVFAMLGGLLFVYSERKPKIIEYDVRTSGIRIGNRVYLYRELLAFNVIERGYGIYLIVQSRRTLVPLIHVPLGDTNPEAVYNTLIEFLDDDPELTESLGDVLSHWFGF